MAVFYNQATLTYSGGSTNSNTASGEITESCLMTKTAVSDSYSPGETITYVVSIVNNGDTELTGVSLSDDLGGYDFGGGTLYPLEYVEGSLLYYVDGVLTPSAGITVTPGAPLTISGIPIPAASNVMLIYSARVTPYAPLGTDAQITNTVTASGLCSALAASETISMEGSAQLTISKSVDPGSVSCGDRITYTFIIQNSGSDEADATAEIAVSDLFDPVLSDIIVNLNGVAMAKAAGYSYDETTGEFATVAGAITGPGATYEQSPDGVWVTTPGTAVLTVEGTV